MTNDSTPNSLLLAAQFGQEFLINKLMEKVVGIEGLPTDKRVGKKVD